MGLFNENALLNGETLESEREIFYKNIEKLKILEEDLKKPVGCGLTIEDWFEFLFDLQDGYAAMFYLNLNREVGQRMYKTFEAKKHVVISEFIHCYVSMNSFYFPKRTKKALRKLGFFYIDVDPRAVGITKEEALKEIRRKIENNIIPKPSALVDSGGGYYIIYKLDPVFAGSEKVVNLFGYIETFLVDMLADVGGDDNAKDACRVLRVPGTINCKYSADTFVEVIEFNRGLIYSFQDFVKLMNKESGFDLDLWRKLKEKRKEEALTKQEEKQQEKIVKKWTSIVKKKFNLPSLLAARAVDYKKITILRGRDVEGFRNTMLHLYSLTQRGLVGTQEELELKVREMNDVFKESMPISEVKSIVKNVWKKPYKYKTKTIVKKLKITPEEQRHLITLIEQDEKNIRNNEKRRNDRRNDDGLTSREQGKIDVINQVKALKQQGLKQVQIAEQLGITKGTVSKYLKL